MKYVFIAHSHTLLLSDIGTCEYLKLQEEEVIFLCTRHFDATYFPRHAKVCRADDEYDLLAQCEERRDFTKAITAIDKRIEEWIGEPYELFTPHLANPLFLLLYHHPQCRKVSFVQEGAFTARGMFVYDVSPFYKLRKRFSLFRRYGNQRLYGVGSWYYDGVLTRQKEIDAYAIYPRYFEYLRCRLSLISWPDLDIELPSDIQGPVFIFDGFVNNGLADQEYYLQQCERMIAKFRGRKNYLKFHPAQSQEEMMRICQMFRTRDLHFEVLDNNIPFELYIMKTKSLTVVGMGSSLLYYAQQRGHRVICCDTWMLNDPNYNHFNRVGIPLFHEYFGLSQESVCPE